MTPSVITACFSRVGVVMNRVSMSTRAATPVLDVAGPAAPVCIGTFSSVKSPATCGFFSTGRVPAAPGMPTKSAPTPPTSAQMCSTLQAPPATAGLGATAATESRNATTTASALARANNPYLVASVPEVGIVENTRPPELGSVATARHGIVTSSARGAPDTSGAVTSEMTPSDRKPCGHRIVAVVCLTGSSGTSPHATMPASPATTAISRATRCARSERSVPLALRARRSSLLGTRPDRMRRS